MIKYVKIRRLKESATPEQYEDYYKDHIPLAHTLTGIRKAVIGKLLDWGDQQAPYYRMTELYWEDYESLQKAFDSPEGQAVLKDELRGRHLIEDDYIEFIAEEEQVL
jgi:uncharacterized protein (TIGR02118 family)